MPSSSSSRSWLTEDQPQTALQRHQFITLCTDWLTEPPPLGGDDDDAPLHPPTHWPTTVARCACGGRVLVNPYAHSALRCVCRRPPESAPGATTQDAAR